MGVARKVVQYTLDGEYIKVWDSANEAGRSLSKKNGSQIVTCCKHLITQVQGFRWLYEEESENAQEVFKKYPLFGSTNEELFSDTNTWRKVADKYYVSKYGELKNRMGKTIKTYKDNSGYKQINTRAVRKYGNWLHLVVAKAFPEICGEWFDGAVVDHIDGNPANNKAENLRVTTMKSNMRNPVTVERMRLREPFQRPVGQYTTDGKFIREYRNAREASAAFGKNPDNSAILGVCSESEYNKCRKTAYGYVWRFMDIVEDLPGEIWRKTDYFKRRYNHFISNMGRVKSRTGRILNCETTSTGYKRLNRQTVHGAVAKAFPEICGEWFEGCEVDHINGVRDDNRAENLRVTDHVGNMNNEGTRKKFMKPYLIGKGFKVICVPSLRHGIEYFKCGKRTLYQAWVFKRRFMSEYRVWRLDSLL